MAKVKFGAMVNDARGKMDGVVYSKNQYGAYVRQKVSPVNPMSARQTLVRQRLANLSKYWGGTLTAAQRQAWSGFAGLNPVTDVFNDKQQLSGLAAFVRLNSAILNGSGAQINTPPANLLVTGLESLTITVTAGPTVVSIAFTVSALAANHKLYIFATPGLSKGITFFKPFLRFIGASAAAQATPFDAAALYTAKFGDTVSGQKVGFMVAVIDTTKGSLAPGLVNLITVP